MMCMGLIIVVDGDVGGCLNLEEAVNKMYILYTTV